MNRLSSLSFVGTALALSGAMLFIDFNQGETGPRAFAAPPPIPLDLSGVTPNWDKNLPSAARFTVLSAFGGAAVRDNNTGLVWEQHPETFNDWPNALFCLARPVGGTFGWRLPSVVELMSVMDPSLPAPFVPASVFTGVQPVIYWTATTFGGDPAVAWIVDLQHALTGFLPKSTVHPAWCVRGPMNADAY